MFFVNPDNSEVRVSGWLINDGNPNILLCMALARFKSNAIFISSVRGATWLMRIAKRFTKGVARFVFNMKITKRGKITSKVMLKVHAARKKEIARKILRCIVKYELRIRKGAAKISGKERASDTRVKVTLPKNNRLVDKDFFLFLSKTSMLTHVKT